MTDTFGWVTHPSGERYAVGMHDGKIAAAAGPPHELSYWGSFSPDEIRDYLNKLDVTELTSSAEWLESEFFFGAARAFTEANG